MHLLRMFVSGGAFLLSALAVGGTAVHSQEVPRCVAVMHGVEYRSYLPDTKRYIYVSVKVLSGSQPSVFVVVDKNYDTAGRVPVKNDPYNAWWIDRSHPMLFSTDRIKARWPDDGTWQTMTGWLSAPDWVETTHLIPGLQQSGPSFVGTGSNDSNTYAFQMRVEMRGFDGDEFDVTLPAVTFDGVTIAPPVVHFQRSDDAYSAKC